VQNVHPLFVHFPIALLLAAVALEVAWWLARRDWLRNSATVSLVLGTLGAIAAVITGLIASEAVKPADAAYSIVEAHESVAISVLCLAVVLTIRRLLNWDCRLSWLFLLAMLAMAGLVAWTGYLGGRLVFEFGVGTAL
jgi:uncharacterized membrane protein